MTCCISDVDSRVCARSVCRQAACDFVCVYTAEAHAQDEWPISSGRYHDGVPVILNQPKTDEERLRAAEAFVGRYEFRWPMVVDPIGEPFDSVYCAWPLRFYVVRDGTLVYKAQPKDCSYDIGHLWRFLQAQTQAQQGCAAGAGGSGQAASYVPASIQPVKMCDQQQCTQ